MPVAVAAPVAAGMTGTGTVAGAGLGLTGVTGDPVGIELGGVANGTGITGGGRGATGSGRATLGRNLGMGAGSGGGRVALGRNLGMDAGSGGVGFAVAFVDPIACKYCFMQVSWDGVLSLKPNVTHFLRASSASSAWANPKNVTSAKNKKDLKSTDRMI